MQGTTVRAWASPHQRAHNLTIDGLHTYYVLAGDQAVLTHNCGGRVAVSPVGPDWGDKGAHLKVGSHEVRLFPDGRGGIGAKALPYGPGKGATDQDVARALEAVQTNPRLRAHLIREARSAMEHMNANAWGMAKNRAAEIHFLIKALEKLG